MRDVPERTCLNRGSDGFIQKFPGGAGKKRLRVESSGIPWGKTVEYVVPDILQERHIVSEFLSLMGESFRKGFDEIVVPGREPEGLVSDDYLVKTVFVKLFPGEVKQIEIAE